MGNKLIIERKPKKDCKPEEYLVTNKKEDVLGQIARETKWRRKQWLFFVNWNPMDGDRDFWMGSNCLKQIAEFLDKLNERDKNK